MDKFLLFDYNLLLDDDGEEFLDSVIIKLVKVSTCQDQLDLQFNELAKKDNFQNMVIHILNLINQQAVQFSNLVLVAPTTAFFTSILEEQFKKRSLQVPFVLQNYLDISKLFRKIEGKLVASLSQMAQYYRQYQLWSNISKMKLVIIRLHFKQLNKLSKQQKTTFNREELLLRQQQVRPRKTEQIYSQSTAHQVNKLIARFLPIEQNNQRKYIGLDFNECSEQVYPIYLHNHRQIDYSLQQQSLREVGRYNVRKAVRIKGLPFEVEEKQIVGIFKVYCPIATSVKIGSQRGSKTGQAVILFQDEEMAEKALEINGYFVRGRYLQVMLISVRSYWLFK